MTGEAQRLAGIRDALDAIAPAIWSRAADEEGEFVEARGEMGELVPVARFHAGATMAERAFASDAPGMVRFLLALVDRAIGAARARGAMAGNADSVPARAQEDPPERRRRDYAAEAAMLCAEPAFKRFLMERHGLESPATTERAAQRLRGLLGVTSRRELNDDAAAASRWKEVRRDFRAWRKR